MALQPSDVKVDGIQSLVSPSVKPSKRKKTTMPSSSKGPVSLNPSRSRGSPVNPKKRKISRDKENGENDERLSDSKDLAAAVQSLLSLISSHSADGFAREHLADSNDSVASPFASDSSNGSPQLANSCQNSPFLSFSSSQSSDSRPRSSFLTLGLVADESLSSALPAAELSSEGNSLASSSSQEKGYFLLNRWLFEYESCINELEAGYAPQVLAKIPALMEILRLLVPSSPCHEVGYWWCFLSSSHFLAGQCYFLMGEPQHLDLANKLFSVSHELLLLNELCREPNSKRFEFVQLALILYVRPRLYSVWADCCRKLNMEEKALDLIAKGISFLRSIEMLGDAEIFQKDKEHIADLETSWALWLTRFLHEGKSIEEKKEIPYGKELCDISEHTGGRKLSLIFDKLTSMTPRKLERISERVIKTMV